MPAQDNFTNDSPFILSINGTASIPKEAERVVLNVQVSASNENKQWASDQVTTTAKHLRQMLQSMSPDDVTPKEEAVVVHWNMTTLSISSRKPRNSNYQEIDSAPTIHQVEVSFSVRVQRFETLGSFAGKLTAMPHVSLGRIEWVLTSDTRKAYEHELRRLAAADALQQARSFGEPLGISHFRPVSLQTTGLEVGPGFAKHSHATRVMQQAAPGAQMSTGSTDATPMALSGEAESDLAFYPEHVTMTINVNVKFIGQNSGFI